MSHFQNSVNLEDGFGKTGKKTDFSLNLRLLFQTPKFWKSLRSLEQSLV